MSEGKALVAELATDRIWQIDCGKDSGLPWWLGSDRKLRPELPVMSPQQVGSCSPDEQDAICAALIAIWRRWIVDTPTKAEALVLWIGEALDTTAQLQAVVAARGGSWVASDTPWSETRMGESSQRLVFREHLADEIVAWFEARGGEYRTTTGDPADWDEPEPPKVVGNLAPDWYASDDPVYELPYAERASLLDWIAALSGSLPESDDGRFAPVGQAGRSHRVARSPTSCTTSAPWTSRSTASSRMRETRSKSRVDQNCLPTCSRQRRSMPSGRGAACALVASGAAEAVRVARDAHPRLRRLRSHTKAREEPWQIQPRALLPRCRQ